MNMVYLETFLLSALPFSELRGGIPYGILKGGLSPLEALVIAVVANVLVAPVGFFFLDHVHQYFMRIKPYRHFFNHFMERARKRGEEKIGKWGYLGLMLLVAIPLPLTGAYTGTLAAWFFELDRRKAMLTIAAGVLIAGLIVAGLIVSGTAAFSIFVK